MGTNVRLPDRVNFHTLHRRTLYETATERENERVGILVPGFAHHTGVECVGRTVRGAAPARTALAQLERAARCCRRFDSSTHTYRRQRDDV